MEPKRGIEKKTILILTGLILATALVIFCEYIFGNKVLSFMDNDIGSDTAQQYVQHYSMLIRRIRTGDFSTWDATNGFGVNIFTYNFGNPFLILIYLIGVIFGAPQFMYALVYVYIFEFWCTGVIAYLFLSEFRFTEKTKLFVSYMYAFNGYILVWGQHYQFAAYSFLAVVVVLAAEKCLRNPKKWPWMTLATALAVMTSAYMGYMIILFTAAYVILRLLIAETKSVKQYFIRGFQIALPMFLGIAMMAVMILPFGILITQVTTRLVTNKTLLERLFQGFFPIQYYKVLYGRMFSTAGYGVSAMTRYLNYYEAPCAYLTLLFVPLAVQYVFTIPTMNTTKRNKVLQYVFLAVMAYAITTRTVPVMMNGFSFSTLRFYYQYMIYFMLIAAVMLDRIFLEKKGYILLYLGTEAIILVRMVKFFFGMWATPKYIMPVLALASLIMTASLILLRKADREKVRLWSSRALLASLVLMVTAEGFGTFDADFIVSEVPPISSRGALVRDGKYFQGMYDENTLAALEWIRENDGEYYRVEKMEYVTYGVDAMAQNYRGVSGYNSTQSGALQEYIDTMWPSLRYWDDNHYFYRAGSDAKDQADLAGIKYVLAVDPMTVPEGFEEAAYFSNVGVYRREGVENAASFYPEGSYEKEETEEGLNVYVSYGERDESAEIRTDGRVSDDTFRAEVETGDDGILYMAVPCEIGWKAFVDGKETEIIRANYAFAGVSLAKGKHTVELKYLCPGLKAGAALSGAAFVLFIALTAIHLKRNAKGKAK